MTGIVPKWLTRAPVAHRGLHGEACPENTLSAVEAACEAGYAAEIDLQLTADGGLVMLHDPELQRTTHRTGLAITFTLDELRAVPLRGCDETLSSLEDVLALIGGRTPLFLELKSRPDQAGRAAIARATTRALGRYGGAAAVMSADPDLLAILRPALADTPLGAVAGGEGRGASLVSRFGRDALLHTPRTKPDFVAYYATALPHPAIALRRKKRPVFAWTVRSQAEAQQVGAHADQIIFENFRP